MVNKLRHIFSALVFAIVGALSAAAETVDTMTGIFDDSFRTLRVEVEGYPPAPPVITLGSDDRFVVSIDRLAYDRDYLRYSVVHCNADWQPSSLTENEYLEGFNMGYVDDWQFSRGTAAHYVNYRFVLPNDDIAFKVSGNYLLQIWLEDDPDTPVAQVRLMVSEATARVEADVLSVTDIDYNDRSQQVSVAVDVSGAVVDDPFNDLLVYVSQNGRYDNEVMVRNPLRVSGTKAFFEHQRPLIFPAGNEYRRFETVSTQYPGMGVAENGYYDPYYHAVLHTDRPRDRYQYDQTQNGRFVVREYNSTRSDIEADYIVTHFSLDIPELPEGQYIFIDGDLVNRRFDPESMMVYNRVTRRYEKVLLLKQGSYNYQYLTTSPRQSAGATSAIEGDFYPTANEYLVKVYNRRRGERYDRLIGVTMTRFR